MISVLNQEPKPYEILVGDDSTNKKTERLVKKYQDNESEIRYFRNQPSLGQAENVDKLFKEVRGDYICLLHDDDLLLDGALKTLLESFQGNKDIVAAFGKQQIIGEDGTIKRDATKNLNQTFYRMKEFEGKQSSALRSAITQQFPNNGYLVKAHIAKDIGYNIPHSGDAIDFAFGLNLAIQNKEDFYYVDKYTAQYRLSKESIIRGSNNTDTAYRSFSLALKSLSQNDLKDYYIQEWLSQKSPVAISMASKLGKKREGLNWYFGRFHRDKIFTLGGIRRLISLIIK